MSIAKIKKYDEVKVFSEEKTFSFFKTAPLPNWEGENLLVVAGRNVIYFKSFRYVVFLWFVVKDKQFSVTVLSLSIVVFAAFLLCLGILKLGSGTNCCNVFSSKFQPAKSYAESISLMLKLLYVRKCFSRIEESIRDIF